MSGLQVAIKLTLFKKYVSDFGDWSFLSMESELEKFRRRKQLEQKKEEIKTKFKSTANSWIESIYNALIPNWDEDETEEHASDQDDNPTSQSETENPASRSGKTKWLMYLVIFLRFLAWFLAYIAFLKIEFGAVFFTISLLIFIYWNTKKSRRRKGEASAYSVFNKDCKSIDGTLKAEHLEKQLLYRS